MNVFCSRANELRRERAARGGGKWSFPGESATKIVSSRAARLPLICERPVSISPASKPPVRGGGKRCHSIRVAAGPHARRCRKSASMSACATTCCGSTTTWPAVSRITGVVAYVAAASGLYQAIIGTALYWVVIFAPLALVLLLSFRIQQHEPRRGAAHILGLCRPRRTCRCPASSSSIPAPASPRSSSSPPRPSWR